MAAGSRGACSALRATKPRATAFFGGGGGRIVIRRKVQAQQRIQKDKLKLHKLRLKQTSFLLGEQSTHKQESGPDGGGQRVLQPEKAAELAPELAQECPSGREFLVHGRAVLRVLVHESEVALLAQGLHEGVWEAPISLASLWLSERTCSRRCSTPWRPLQHCSLASRELHFVMSNNMGELAGHALGVASAPLLLGSTVPLMAIPVMQCLSWMKW